jgi:hypothetical protein
MRAVEVQEDTLAEAKENLLVVVLTKLPSSR